MSDSPQQPPISRKVLTQQPGIIGAQWWNDGLTAMGDPVSRRSALKALATIGGTVMVGGCCFSTCVSGISDSSSSYSFGNDETIQFFDALQMQRERGWNLGGESQALNLTGQQSLPTATEAPEKLVSELTPQQDALKPFYQATLFQALSHTAPGAAGTATQALRSAVRPIFTPEMDEAWRRGEALADLFEREEDTTTAVMVDLPGPESVAFAAALARRFEPVFTFDNWPHPLGVVPAHQTLAAVLYYRDTFKRLSYGRRPPAPPVFVLDNKRLATFIDPNTQFDNRYVARLPPAKSLQDLGIKHVLYVLPTPASMPELDDLNEDFTEYRRAGLDVKLVAADDFRPDPLEVSRAVAGASPSAVGYSSASGMPVTLGAPDGGVAGTTGGTASADGSTAAPPRPRYHFGGSPLGNLFFWTLYPWGRTPGPRVDPNAVPFRTSGGHRYQPQSRSTMFTGMPRGAAASAGAARPRPGNNFGMVMMRVATANRAILGPGFGPQSSWNRSSSYGGG
jgi:hypothetical protein